MYISRSKKVRLHLSISYYFYSAIHVDELTLLGKKVYLFIFVGFVFACEHESSISMLIEYKTPTWLLFI